MPAVAKPGRSPQTLPHQVLLALLLLVEPPSGLQPSPRGLSLGVAPSRPWAPVVNISRHQGLCGKSMILNCLVQLILSMTKASAKIFIARNNFAKNVIIWAIIRITYFGYFHLI